MTKCCTSLWSFLNFINEIEVKSFPRLHKLIQLWQLKNNLLWTTINLKLTWRCISTVFEPFGWDKTIWLFLKTIWFRYLWDHIESTKMKKNNMNIQVKLYLILLFIVQVMYISDPEYENYIYTVCHIYALNKCIQARSRVIWQAHCMNGAYKRHKKSGYQINANRQKNKLFDMLKA